MIDKEDYKKLMATLERIEKAGTLADIVKMAPDLSREDATFLPSVYGEDSFERIHNQSLLNMATAMQKLEEAAARIKFSDRYCKDLYKNYKLREKEIKHPDILKFIKDYEAYYHTGGEE